MSDYVSDAPDDRSEQLDQDQLQPGYSLNDRGVEDALDEGYSPPEKPSVLLREGEHDTMDSRLAEEDPEPDPYTEPEDARTKAREPERRACSSKRCVAATLTAKSASAPAGNGTFACAR